MVFLALLLIPLFIILGTYLWDTFYCTNHNITFREFLLQLGVQVLLVGMCVGVMYWSNTTDNEIWNGRITNKKREEVSCRHSYQCYCYESCSGSGKNRSCHQVCQTCYEHSYDVDWAAHNTNNETFDFDSPDRQGLVEPTRWTQVKIGEPTSTSHSFTNYIKASPDSLFRHKGLLDKYNPVLPPYPGDVYDYYRINRVVQVGGSLPEVELWNKQLSEVNADLGGTKQVNIVLVFTWGQVDEFFYALQQKWLGGKKNDVIVVVGLRDTSIQWVNVLAWTIQQDFQVKLRDDLLSPGPLDKDVFLQLVRTNIVKYYRRKPMADFAYLQASITPTTNQWIISMILGIVVAIVLQVIVVTQDLFRE